MVPECKMPVQKFKVTSKNVAAERKVPVQKFKVTSKNVAAERKVPVQKFKVTSKNVAAECKVPVQKFKVTSEDVAAECKVPVQKIKITSKLNCGKRKQEMALQGETGKKQKQEMDCNMNCGKRKPEMALEGETGKKLKQEMDCNTKLQLSKILKELIGHPTGWIFAKAVDPVKLKIPDYFSIVTKPMDLGTIRHKLEGSMYSNAEEFAADVRLTFSNAMLYNPPENQVHQFARMLDTSFSNKWKLLEAELKYGHGKKNDEATSYMDRVERNDRKTKKMGGNGHQKTKKMGDTSHRSTRPIGAPLPVKDDTSRTSIAGLNDDDETKVKAGTATAEGCLSDVAENGWAPTVLMSPKMALRAAMLKKRFVNTIFKATHPEFLDHGKSDPVRRQHIRERLEREKREEEARIEAQIRAAKAASRKSEHENLKIRRERERKAARTALEKIQKTVDITDNVRILEDLEMMGNGYLYYPTNGRSLEQFGLYFKDDFPEEEDKDAILKACMFRTVFQKKMKMRF